jgi:hypothetical protein
MMKALPLCVVGLLITAGLAAAGQPYSLVLEETALPAVQPPVTVDGACPLPPPGPPAGAPAVLTADLDYVLWFFPFRHNDKERTAVVSGPPTASSTGVLSTFREEGLYRFVSGGRLSLGYWFVEPNPWVYGGIRTCGVEGNVFVVGGQAADFRDAGSATILRPFGDANNGRSNNVVVAFPGLATGSFDVTARRSDFWGAEVNFVKNVDYDYPGTNCSFDVLAGTRFLSMSQGVEFHRKTIFLDDLSRFPEYRAFAGNTLEDSDLFQVHNRFYGGQVGVVGRFHCGGFTLEGIAKLALGATNQRYLIQGQQVRTLADGTTISSQGGLYALPSNSGRFTKTRFAEVPELTLNASWKLLDCLGVHVGFSTLRWNQVAYPGDQVTLARDISEIPGFPGGDTAARVSRDQLRAPLRSSSLWLSGINIGAEVAW